MILSIFNLSERDEEHLVYDIATQYPFSKQHLLSSFQIFYS